LTELEFSVKTQASQSGWKCLLPSQFMPHNAQFILLSSAVAGLLSLSLSPDFIALDQTFYFSYESHLKIGKGNHEISPSFEGV